MAGLDLRERERGLLAGVEGKAGQLAMRLLVAAADAAQVRRFVDIEFAHINSCHYSGQLSLDFAEFLLAEGVSLAVPTHTNASLIACDAPELRPEASTPAEVNGARRLMMIYEELGCTPMWTCAPYQEHAGRPSLGAQIVGSESNAVSFFNSALGARTNKYGDLLDISAAIVGRVPYAGLHTDEGRLATHLVELRVSDPELADPTLPHLLGVIIGQACGVDVPVITGLPSASEDGLKAIAAAAATAGAVEMFHVVGVTPEAPDLATATGRRPPARRTVVDAGRLAAARRALTTDHVGTVTSVCLGTPHFSVDEFAELRTLLAGRRVLDHMSVLVTTSRAVLAELGLRGWLDDFRLAGVDIVTDTCTYYPPQAKTVQGTVMTNSAKWAYYAPGMLPIEVAFGSLDECVAVAVGATT